MMKKVSFVLLLMVGLLIRIECQINVATNNNVGVGTTNPLSKLSVNTEGSSSYTFMSYASGGNRAAQFELENPSNSTYNMVLSTYIRNQAVGGKNVAGNFYAYQGTAHYKKMFGVRATAGNGLSGYNYGVIGILGGSNNGAGIVGTLTSEPTINGQYAGYFNGDIYVTGTVNYGTLTQNSDINLKKDIRPLNDGETNQISKLRSLNAIKYKFKTPVELGEITPAMADTMKIDPRTKEYTESKYTRDQIGFSAQELQQVYPELVSTDQAGYLCVNYIELIPILVEAIKEGDATIAEVDNTIQGQDIKIQQLEADNQTQDASIIELNSTTESQGNVIVQLDTDLKDQGAALAAQDETILAQGAAIEALNAALEAQAAEIEKLKAELAKLQSSESSSSN